MAGLTVQNQSYAGETRICIENNIVPYLSNPLFIRLQILFETMKRKLFAQVPNQFNHRIALYGMGGVSKTQMAQAYVYAYVSIYDRIYWVSALNKAALLSPDIKRLPTLLEFKHTETQHRLRLWKRCLCSFDKNKAGSW